MTHRFLRSFSTGPFSTERPLQDALVSRGESSTQGVVDSATVSVDKSRPDTAGNSSSAVASPTWSDGAGRPVELYIPEQYEPNYPYPLLVWLHGSGGSEADLSTVMPGVSTRNCFGIAFRGLPSENGDRPFGFRWSQTDEEYAEFRQSLYETVCRLRGRYHIHSERVFMAGFEDGATLALKLLLDRPEWFGGAMALSGGLPQQRAPLVRFRELRGRRVFLGCGARDHRLSPAEMVRVGRLLHTAGMDVSTRIFDAANGVTPAMLSELNRFILDGICTAG